MKWTTQTIRRLGRCSLALSLLLFIVATPAIAGENCLGSPHWISTPTGRYINHTHIFCGELNRRGRLVGFHSRPQGENPSTVLDFNITQPANRQGIYAGRWTYSGTTRDNKFSTLFPDHCSEQQVIHSIAYAEAQRVACPAGAPHWAWCGPNRPADAEHDSRFCQAKDGSSYMIAGASLTDGRINTAFPLR